MKINKLLPGLLFVTILSMSFVHPNDWFLFETKDYKIYFPQKPTDQSQTINTALGYMKATTYMYEVPEGVKDDNLVYSVTQTQFPDSIINSDKTEILSTFFRNSIDGAIKNVRGKLLQETIIQIENFPGREIKVDFRDGLAVITMRFYLVKNTMYYIQTFTDANKDFNNSIDKFMNSFTLSK